MPDSVNFEIDYEKYSVLVNFPSINKIDIKPIFDAETESIIEVDITIIPEKVDIGVNYTQEIISKDEVKEHDPVNYPKHYTHYKGLEIIQLTEQMNFCRGNAVKYIARAGIKDEQTELQDLEKAAWFLQREIDRLRSD